MSGMKQDRAGGGDVVTITGALKEGVRLLTQSGIDRPNLTAQILLSHLLGKGRAHLVTCGRDPLPRSVRSRYSALLRRCADGEPLQYLVGEREFFGLTFRVTRDVLIPRPETEHLVERAIHLAETHEAQAPVWVDVGTGSGCIAVSVASAVDGSVGWAVDSSDRALSVAKENARRHLVQDRIQFVCGDILESFAADPIFDIVLCNPPYIALGDRGCLDRNVADHEPHEALFGGPSGLDIINRLLPQAHLRLRAGGILLLEVGFGQADEVVGLAQHQGFIMDDVIDDLQGIPRCIVAHKQPGGAAWTK
jgi:release factor glutamine methyltransferase